MNGEPVLIGSGDLFARIDPLGAELQSLRDSLGREYLWQGDSAWWTGRAPILFPIVGALNGGVYRHEGREYPLSKHGFARTSRFELLESNRSSAVFRMSQSAATREVFPFAFTLDLAFVVDRLTLEMHATVSNTGDRPMPFSFGFHPAFQWPLPGGADKDAHRLTFAHAEPAPVRRIGEDNLLLPDPQPSPVEGDILAPRAELFEADALIWDRLKSDALTFGASGGSALEIRWQDCPYFGIWQKPGAPYLAIEPWHGINDPEGFDGDIFDKPGIIALRPGAQRSFRMDVTVRPG